MLPQSPTAPLCRRCNIWKIRDAARGAVPSIIRKLRRHQLPIAGLHYRSSILSRWAWRGKKARVFFRFGRRFQSPRGKGRFSESMTCRPAPTRGCRTGYCVSLHAGTGISVQELVAASPHPAGVQLTAPLADYRPVRTRSIRSSTPIGRDATRHVAASRRTYRRSYGVTAVDIIDCLFRPHRLAAAMSLF